MGAGCLESLPILQSDLVRVYRGRPAALPTATGWDEEPRARTAGVRLPRPGSSESSFGTDVRSCSATGVTGGPESVRHGWDGGRKNYLI